MKKARILSALLLFTMILTACGGESLPKTTAQTGETETLSETGATTLHPIEGAFPDFPDYRLPAGATPDQMRQMAVKAMRDELTVRWTPAEKFHYDRTSDNAPRSFDFYPGKAVTGLPYTDAHSGLIQFLQYYDFETGIFTTPNKNLDGVVGNVCRGSVQWGIMAVCAGYNACDTAGKMAPGYGFYPVGEYKIPEGLDGVHSYGTLQITRDNGEQVMFRSYAAVLPADTLLGVGTDSPARHVNMAAEAAHVEKDAAGNIDPDKSYLVIQEQMGGEYSHTDYGAVTLYQSRLDQHYSFRKLYEQGYIPVTTGEFLGLVPYTVCEASFTPGEGEGLEAVFGGSVSSNYVLATIRMNVVDQNGKTVASRFRNFSLGSAPAAREATLEDFSKRRAGKELWETVPAGDYTLQVQVFPACGGIFTVNETAFTVK